METRTCSEHRTPVQEARVDYRSVEKKRNWLKVGDTVYATSGYKRMMSDESDFEGGKIVGFEDPSDWKGKTASSCAYVEMSCGCVKYISTGWLAKR